MEEAERILQEVEARGIDLGQVYADLQTDGVEAFADSYRSLIESVLSKAGE
jgi:hypothetical protein